MSASPIAIGVVGPFGSGKTHALAEIAPELERSGLPARLIINDLTTSGADSETLGGLRSLTSMLTGGCVGCGDAASFLRELQIARDNGLSVLAESPATLHVAEIREALRAVYGKNYAFLTMWDTLASQRNIIYPPASTTLTIGDVVALTNHESGGAGDRTIVNDIGAYMMQGARIFYIPRRGYGSDLADALIDSASSRVEALDIEHGHNHENEHEHDDHDDTCNHSGCYHEHHHHQDDMPSIAGMHAKWLESVDTTHGIQFVPSVEVEELLKVLSLSPSILRAKGHVYANGRLCVLQYTPESYTIEPVHSGVAHLECVVYGTDKQVLVDAASTCALQNSRDESRDTMDFKTLLASTEFSDEIEQLIIADIALYGNVWSNGSLLADYGEADMAYHIAKQVKGVPDHLKRLAFAAYIQQRLTAVDQLPACESVGDRSWLCLRLGMVLAFHDMEAESHLISDEDRALIRQASSATLMVEGMRTVTPKDFKFDAKRRVAEENPELLVKILKFAVQEGQVSYSDASDAFDTMKTRYILHCTDVDLVSWWSSTELSKRN